MKRSGRAVRIGIDARKEWDGGIGRYVRNLVQGLSSDESVTRLHVWVKPGSERLRIRTKRIHPHVERAGLYSLGEQFSLGWKVRKTALDLFHAPHYVVPFFLKIPLVVTIHDIIHLIFPKSSLHAAYAHRQLGFAVKRAQTLIMPSEFSRKEVIRYFPDAAKKSVSIHHGIAPFFCPGPSRQDDAIRRSLKLPETFPLYVGNHKPHKNLSQLLEVCREIFGEFPDLFLCVTGNREDENGALNRLARQYRVSNRIHYLGILNNEALRACYRAARVFAFPSLYEGFGFPPLEAMACGTPVVAFRTASLPEVVADGGILIEPGDGRGFYQALRILLRDEEARGTWRDRGMAQAGLFRWARAIEAHLDTYRSVLKNASV